MYTFSKVLQWFIRYQHVQAHKSTLHMYMNLYRVLPFRVFSAGLLGPARCLPNPGPGFLLGLSLALMAMSCVPTVNSRELEVSDPTVL